ARAAPRRRASSPDRVASLQRRTRQPRMFARRALAWWASEPTSTGLWQLNWRTEAVEKTADTLSEFAPVFRLSFFHVGPLARWLGCGRRIARLEWCCFGLWHAHVF